MPPVQETDSNAPKSTVGADPCLLTYRFSTDPEPLQSSTAQTSITGLINLSVSASSTAYCNQIQIAVPIGSDATDYSEQTPSDSVNTAKWSLESLDIKKGSDIGADDSTNYAVFIFQTRDSTDNEINYNLVFGISAAVNQTTGVFDYIVQETSGTTNDPATFTAKKATFSLEKTTPQFYLKNFVATTTAAPTVPSTEFANAADIRLAWESNGTYFQIFEKNNATPIYSGSDTTFTLSPGVATSSTFILVASVTGDPSDDNNAGYQPIYLYESLTITISNPDLTPSSNAVSGNETIGGTLAVTGDTALSNASLSGTLGVSGASTLADTSAANLSASGTLGVTGATTLTNTTVNGTLGVTGAANAGSLNVSGNASAAGAVSGGSVSSGGSITGGYLVSNGVVSAKGTISSTVGPYNAGAFTNNGTQYTLGTTNTHSDKGYITGVAARVASSSDYGLGTNGKIGSFSSTSVFTHIPTSNGHRMVTSPLTPNIEVQLNGQGQLSGGKAVIEFEAELAEIIIHSEASPYKVILTPTGECNGLAVVDKCGGSFTVSELAGGDSDATFDWLVIAAKPEALNSGFAHPMPAEMPKMLDLSISE